MSKLICHFAGQVFITYTMKKFLLFLIPFTLGFCLFGCARNIEDVKTLYEIKLAYMEEEHKLLGEMSVNYTNTTGETLNYVCFHLYPNAFREGSSQSVVSLANYNRAYYNGKSYGDIEIISSNKNFSLTGEDENILKLELENPLAPNDFVILNVEFETLLPEINHRIGVGENTINFGNAFPILCVYEHGDFDMNGYHSNGDPFYSEISDYSVEIAYPEKYTLASSGEVVNEYKEEELTRAVIKAENVRDFMFVLSDKFEVLTESVGNTQVSYYYYDDEQPEKSLETSVLALQTFNSLFGEYPYKRLSVVEASFVHGGMEFPNLVLISDSLGSYETYTTVIIHEIAHQWWYGIVGNDQYNYGWLDEGLAEFSTALFYDKNPSYNVTREQITFRNQSNFKVFEKIYTNVLGEIDTSFNRALNEFDNEQEYVYTAYVKAYLMHDTLYELLGAKKYEKCLKEYFNENKYKLATPESLVSAFEKASGKNLESFFYSWFEDNVIIG